MQFKTFLNEMPMTIRLSKKSVLDRIPSYIMLLKNSKTADKVGMFQDHLIYKYDNPHNTEYFVIDEENRKPLFYSKISTVTGTSYDGKVNRQSLIWQDDEYKASSYIFMEIILENHKIILSDDSQTKGGKLFWEKLVNKYRGSSRYEVGYYDKIDKKYVPFTKTEGNFKSLYKDDHKYYSNLYIKKSEHK